MRGSRRHSSLGVLGPCLALLVAAAGCATSYGPKGFLGAGFSERKLGPDLWLVTFDASAFTPTERVQSYLLLRCAELTVEQGNAYFVVMAQGRPRRIGPTVPSLIDQPPFSLDRPAPEPAAGSEHSARAAIHIYREKPEEKSYDARAVVRRLSAGPGS